MIYQAQLLPNEDDSEHHFNLKIENHVLSCFSTYCPHKVNPHSTYPVELYLYFSGDVNAAHKENNNSDEIKKNGAGYKYTIIGTLLSGHLISCGLSFNLQEFASEIEHLDGKKIKIDVSRIDVEFQ
jgi:hypothetical protein